MARGELMRILNRPMFRYGGPIREGIMHGMSDGGRIGFADGPKKKYKLEETPIGKFGNWLHEKAVPGAAYYGIGTPISSVYDLAAVPINTLSRMFGYNPGFSGTKFLDQFTGGKYSKFTGFKPDVALGTSADTGWTIESMKEGKTAAELELEKLKKQLAEKKVATTSRFDDTAPIITQSMKDKIAKDARTKRYNDYLEMMGYDRSKRTAGSKALIDTSALIQEATEEAGSLKEADWGKLINKAIQAASTRYDKPEQIREAVGLMTTKAAIEKDLTKETDALKTEALKLQIKGAKKSLAGSTLAEDIAASYVRNQKLPSGSKLAGLARTHKIEVTKVLPSDKIPDDMSAIDYITIKVKKSHDDGDPFPPGNYVIKDRLIKIDADGTITDLIGG